MDTKTLLDHADDTRQNAYAPYSKHHVGAALLTTSGAVFTGCNVENAAYTPTSHAEGNAVSAAVREGHTTFEAIAIVTDELAASMPCGLCRQTLREFCDDDFRIHSASSEGYETATLGDLFPQSFGPNNLDIERE
jgi:cytidine deaminase